MEILSLGHSAFLLEMSGGNGGAPVRILGDPWITDHCVGDLMGRFPRLRFETADLDPIDGIFLSHSHTDHLDPESLVRLYSGLDPKPALLLPVSLAFLEDTLREFLPVTEVVTLRDRERLDFRGVELEAFFDPGARGTNEDDVMVLVADNGREVFLNEADALLPLYDPEVRDLVAGYLGGRETAAFLTTRNELGATMGSLMAKDPADRVRRVDGALEAMQEEIEAVFVPIDDGRDPLWGNDRLVRLIAGQGLAWPAELGGEWNRVLFPIRREDRVRMEREFAGAFDLGLEVEEFVPGAVHVLESGGLAGRREADFLRRLDDEADRRFDPGADLFSPFPVAPLGDEDRDVPRERIATALSERFLPWLIGLGAPTIERLLTESGGEYRIRIRYGTTRGYEEIDYRIGFDALSFAPVEPSGEPDEHYWANDLLDFFDGRADEFSVFCRKPLGGRSQRFWHCLGLPFLNQDLVARKVRRHFERAARGETSAEWVLPFYEVLRE